MKKYGNYYYYVYLDNFYFNIHVQEFREREKELIGFHPLIKIKKIFKKNFNIIYKSLVFNSLKKLIQLEPIYTYNNQFFAKQTFFFNFLKENNYDGGLFFKNNIKKTSLYQAGNSFYLTHKTDSDVNLDVFKKEEYNSLFKIKHYNLFTPSKTIIDDINILFNYNISFFINLEIYKILVLILISKK